MSQLLIQRYLNQLATLKKVSGIDLLARVTRVFVETVRIVEAMRATKR